MIWFQGACAASMNSKFVKSMFKCQTIPEISTHVSWLLFFDEKTVGKVPTVSFYKYRRDIYSGGYVQKEERNYKVSSQADMPSLKLVFALCLTGERKSLKL